MNDQIQIQRYEQPSAVMNVAEVRSQIATIHQIMTQIMKQNEHYGKIPGCGDKPVLLLPGAQKLAMAFRLSPRYEVTIRDYEGGHREYDVRATLTSSVTGAFLGEGVGSCNTMETKYRYRSESTGRQVPQSYWATRNPVELGGPEFSARKVDGKWIVYHREEQGNPADYYNTCLKMAKKRALVDAVLTATAASDIFLPEDDTDGYGDQTSHDAPPPTIEQPKSKAPGNGNGGPRLVTEPQVKRLFALMKQAGKTPEQLKAFLKDKYGIEHTNELTMDAYEEVCDWVQ